ncbi:MAG: PIN domain-containing protein [Betaproteobacteria bacterium]|nr:MAG: PIN domain-containing protein [Betaproteobacteria bacterium]TMH81689.1 MAG: PIN domain-containing protein [Betaproteobacteria bacterium]
MRNIIVDTGPLVALFHARDKHHEAAKAVLESNPAALVSTWPVITEACHFLAQAGRHALLTFVRRGALRLESLSIEDVSQLDELLARYERMDFADATLVLIAEKTGVTEIFTIDRRDFEVYRTRSGRRLRLLLA